MNNYSIYNFEMQLESEFRNKHFFIHSVLKCSIIVGGFNANNFLIF